MKILGIGGSNHDISFCYLHNGSIERATEEERISREKHGGGLKSLCFRGMDYCLGNTSPKELDLIVANDILTESTRENYCGLNMIKINHHFSACCQLLLYVRNEWSRNPGARRGAEVPFSAWAKLVPWGMLQKMKFFSIKNFIRLRWAIFILLWAI